MGKSLIVAGIILVVCGVALTYSDDFHFFGKLPGDIHIQRGSTTYYLPITSCIVISILLSLGYYIYEKLR